ncbi:hypothetical protein DFH06DRAFT_1151805 [Mycena polygramma]|nr:hypothetical protein DFH06DRAFT_1151805 [Mycena polygramma]
MSIPALQARLFKARRIFHAWRSNNVQPTNVHILPLEGRVEKLLIVPWTELLVIVEEYAVHLQDWVSRSSYRVPLHLDRGTSILMAKTYWVDSLGHNVLLVVLYNGRDLSSMRSELKLFLLNAKPLSATYLATATLPYGVIALSLSDTHLALVGYRGNLAYVIASLCVSYNAPCSISINRVACISTEGTLATSSFAILDETHYLLAGPRGVAVYTLTGCAVPASDLANPSSIGPCWKHSYRAYDPIWRPPLGPVVVDHARGRRSIMICTARSIRRVFVTDEPRPRFSMCESPLPQPIPIYSGLVAHHRIGLHRGPRTAPHSFITFQLGLDEDLLPFECRSSSRRGLVTYRTRDPREAIDRTSMNIDEGEGRIVFMTRTRTRRGPSVVILELA